MYRSSANTVNDEEYNYAKNTINTVVLRSTSLAIHYYNAEGNQTLLIQSVYRVIYQA